MSSPIFADDSCDTGGNETICYQYVPETPPNECSMNDSDASGNQHTRRPTLIIEPTPGTSSFDDSRNLPALDRKTNEDKSKRIRIDLGLIVNNNYVPLPELTLPDVTRNTIQEKNIKCDDLIRRAKKGGEGRMTITERDSENLPDSLPVIPYTIEKRLSLNDQVTNEVEIKGLDPLPKLKVDLPNHSKKGLDDNANATVDDNTASLEGSDSVVVPVSTDSVGTIQTVSESTLYHVVITSISSSDSFYCMVVSKVPEDNREIEFLRAVEKLNALLDLNKLNLQDLVQVPLCGEIVAGLSVIDNCWYRAKVIDQLEFGIFSVLFIDYGTTEILEFTRLRILPPDYSDLPPQAIHCILDGLKIQPLHFEKTQTYLKRLINQAGTIHVIRAIPDLSPVVKLYDKDGFCVNDMLISINLEDDSNH